MGSVVRVRGLDAAASRLGAVLGLGVAPALVAAAFLVLASRHGFGFDFRVYWQASRDVLAGHSPYVSPATIAAAPPEEPHAFFVYPPTIGVLLAPFSFLSLHAAVVLYTVFLAGCLVVALLLLGVRDWRCYGVTAASLPVLSSLRLGALTPVLVLALAVAWRHRRCPAIAGVAIGAAIVAKLFLWPLLAWLLLTRRFRAAAVAAAGGVAATALVWATLGFGGLARYPQLLRSLSSLESFDGFSPAAMAARLDVPAPHTTWLAVALPVAVLLVALASRAGAGTRDEALFGASLAAALLLTPILWLHYFALLVVPIAIRRRSFGPEWLVLLAFWITPSGAPAHLPLWRIALALTLAMAGARIAPRPTLSRLPGGKP